MSRHRIPHATHEVFVGHDSPMETFFFQIFRPLTGPDDKSEDYERVVSEAGMQPREIQDIHRFKQVFETQASREAGVEVELSLEMQAQLMLDQSEATGPTPLQRLGLKWAAEFEQMLKEDKS